MKISVVIPTYNNGNLIPETLDSVLAQTFRDFEIIVVDDGSTDETPSVLLRYGDKIRVVRQDNQGLHSARNAGIRNAKGDFIALLDSDDLWFPKKLELQMEIFKKTPDLQWVYSDHEVFNGNTGRTMYVSGRADRLYDGDILSQLFLNNFIGTPTPIIRRTVFDEVGYFYDNKTVTEDWDMWLRIAARHPVGLAKEPLARYRIHPGMKTLNRTPEKQLERVTNTLHRALAREPVRLAPIKNQAIANMYVQAGLRSAKEGSLSQARRMFLRAIRQFPWAPKAYIYYVACFAGNDSLQQINKIRYWLRRVNSKG